MSLKSVGRQLIAGPALEPLTVQELATHLWLDSSNLEPVPSAPTAALAGAGAGNVNNGAHRYRVTFVTAVGETDGGDISGVVTVVNSATDGRVSLTNIPLGGSQVTARKIYRTQAGGSVYLLLTTLADNTTTTYTDNTADAGLGAGVPSTNTTGDPTLISAIQTARELTETWLRRALITQQWRFFYDCFANDLKIPLPPLLSVDAFKYKAWDGTLTDVLAAVYRVDLYSLPGRILKNFGQVWPITYPQEAVVQVDVTCGYGPARANVPQTIKDAMKLLAAGIYENPQGYGPDTINRSPVLGAMLSAYRYKEY